ncbi:MAG: hypothetical protein WAS94_00195 [Candidatus Saccharimonadales bacterium]
MNDINIDYKNLVKYFLSEFKNSKKISSYKHVDEHITDNKLVGDVYISDTFKTLPDGDIRFTIMISPFSAKEKNASSQLLVYNGIKLIDSRPWEKEVLIRTGIMDAVAIKASGLTCTNEDRILYVGSGKIAQVSLAAMIKNFGDNLLVDYIRASDKPSEELQSIYQKAKFTKKSVVNFEDYSYIFCHTNSSDIIINRNNLKNTSKLKLLTYYIDSSIGFEVEPEWLELFVKEYSENRLFVDVPETIKLKKEFQLIKHDPRKIKSLVDVLNSKDKPDNSHPLVFRSGGSALQNTFLYESLYE